jgi:hypothetical protein
MSINLNELLVDNAVPEEVAARIDLVNIYGEDQAVVDNMTTDMVLLEYNTKRDERNTVVDTTYTNIDLDTILNEWAWRCDKGYPDFNNISDRIRLQEVLDEMGIKLPFDRLDERPADADKVAQQQLAKSSAEVAKYPKTLLAELQKYDKLGKFQNFINTLPGGMVPSVVLEGITKICTNKTNAVELVKVFKANKQLTALTKINPDTGIYKLLYNIQPKGTGPGEILIAWCIDGTTVQGGNVSYDIDYNGQHWEVKSLIDPNSNTPYSIDPAKYGEMPNFKFTRKFQAFWEDILVPYYENKLRDDVVTITDNKTVQAKLIQLLDILETIPTTTVDGSTPLEYAGEIRPTIFNQFYNAITKMNGLLPTSVKDTATSSRIAVKSSSVDSQYWIDPDDAKDIINKAGKDTEVTIKVGSKITDESKSAKIWLSKLMNNEFIKSPKAFVDGLKAIRDGFSVGKDGIIYLTKGKFNLSDGMQDFITSHISRRKYRFSLKDLKGYKNYEYQKQQN